MRLLSLMHFSENTSLTSLNTFGIRAQARLLATAESLAELRYLLLSVSARNLPLLVLGGGSNIILSGDFPGLVLRPALRGIRCYAEDAAHVYVAVAAGENWHDFVRHSLRLRWYGLENLSLIPGTVGAAPIQNIGAYGVELTDVMDSLTAMHIPTGELREFSHAECGFAYRDSVFKQALKDQYVITEVRFRLRKQPELHIAYGDIPAELERLGLAATPEAVSQAVVNIRSRKLPDPAVIGNAGSFFKNPLVSQTQYEALLTAYPRLVAYPQGEVVKLAAGWLIEQAGWKGRRLGPVGPYEKQALVLVNHGGAVGAEVMAAARAVQAAVEAQFGVSLEMEPRVY